MARAARRAGLAVEVIDVDGDPDLLESFGDRVPVVLASDGSVLAEGHIERRSLTEAVRGIRG